MRTLLVCLACVVLVGCAKPVPPGMEKMGSTRGFVYNAGDKNTKEQMDNASVRNAAEVILDFAVGVAVDSSLPPLK